MDISTTILDVLDYASSLYNAHRKSILTATQQVPPEEPFILCKVLLLN